MRLWLVNEFEITSKSPISSKPSAPRVEGLEADFFTLNAWKKWKTEGLEGKNPILCKKEMAS